MGKVTAVNWALHSFTAWEGCSKVSGGCLNCYAERNDKRQLHENACHWGLGRSRRSMSDAYWQQPLAWDRAAAHAGKHPIVLCCELADWCDDDPGVPAGQRERLWNLIRQTPNLRWALLTKRTENIARLLPDDWGDGWQQVILGATVESRDVLHRLDDLRAVPAKARYVSFEPLVEDLGQISLSGINWAIVGGESGDGDVRPFRAEWAETLQAQCREQGVAFWCKQLGAHPEYLSKTIILTDTDKNNEEHHSKSGEDWSRWPESLQHLKVRQLPLLSGDGPVEDQSAFHHQRINVMNCDLRKLAQDLGPVQTNAERDLRHKLLGCERNLFATRKEKAEVLAAYHTLYAPLRKWSEFCRIAGIKRQTGYDQLHLEQRNCTESVQSPCSMSPTATPDATQTNTRRSMPVDKAVKEARKRIDRVFERVAQEERAEAVRLLCCQLNEVHSAEHDKAA